MLLYKNINKVVEAKGELVVNKIADKIVKPKPVPKPKSNQVEEIYISPEQRQEMIQG